MHARLRGGTGPLLALALCACSGDRPPPPPPAAAPLPTVVARADGDAQGVPWDGVVEAVRHATLAAQTGGRVAELGADIGDPVGAGALLVRLTSVEQQADTRDASAALAAAEARRVQAEARWQRVEALAPGQYVSRAQLDEARTARDAARAERDAARARLTGIGQQAAYTVIRAPYAGVVSHRYVEPGETVGAGQALLALYQPGPMRIEVQVPQGVAEAIRARPEARVTLADGRVLQAARVVVHPVADASTHSVGVRVLLPGPDAAVAPGSTARVVFPGAAGSDAAPWLPAAAIVRRGELLGAYVVTPQRVVLRQVRLGQRRGERVEVLSGVKAGERVAIDPVAALQAAERSHAAAGTGHD